LSILAIREGFDAQGRICDEEHCQNEPHIGGYCRLHYEEHERERLLRSQAKTALDTGAVNDRPIADHNLRDELEEIRQKWGLVCAVSNSQHGNYLLPLHKAEFVSEWCISLAAEIIKAQRDLDAGEQISSSYERTRRWVWEQFRLVESVSGGPAERS
jgi:hypothetical protein